MDNSSDNDKDSYDLKQASPARKQGVAAGKGVANELSNAAILVKGANSEAISSLPSKTDNACDVEGETEENIEINPDNTTLKTGHLCPTSEEKTPENQQPHNISHLRSLSVPTPPKLISAMKGSREKEGGSPRKLTVSWAPDVYDPPPTSLSHLPKQKAHHQYKNTKKYSKKKQKGKNVRGGSSNLKDKKHHHRMSRKSEPLLVKYDPNRVPASSDQKASSELLDINEDDLESPDSSCGSSFLRKAPATMHNLAYAEAT